MSETMVLCMIDRYLGKKLAEKEHILFMNTMSCYHVKYVYINKDLAEDCKIRKCN